MPQILDAVETHIGTHFAMLSAIQAGVDDDAPTSSFATSSPGRVRFTAGCKFSNVRIRAERWDERPPAIDAWEDFDDIPFQEDPGAGPLLLSGFDQGTVGLDVTGLGVGRIQLFARGRHRYDYEPAVDVDDLPPEEWLLRLYPQDGPISPLAGGPRRTADALAHRSPWRAAVLGLRASGWDSALSGSRGFDLARSALMSATSPLTRLELAMLMVRSLSPAQLGGPDSESTPLPQPQGPFANVDPLMQLSGSGPLATIGDAIDAMIALGLLLTELRAGVPLLVPNPAPEPAWQRTGVTGQRLAWAREMALADEHLAIAIDIESATWWAGAHGLRASPREMALRWSTSIENVLGGIRQVGGSGRVVSDREIGFDAEIDRDEKLVLRPGVRGLLFH